jgi:hypothetical protein
VTEPKSSVRTTFGWSIWLPISASRANRSLYRGAEANSGGTSFTATCASVVTSRASKTMPMPPRPTSRMMR